MKVFSRVLFVCTQPYFDISRQPAGVDFQINKQRKIFFDELRDRNVRHSIMTRIYFVSLALNIFFFATDQYVTITAHKCIKCGFYF